MVPLARTRRRTKAGCDRSRSLEPDAEPKRVHDGVEASAGVAALRRSGTTARGRFSHRRHQLKLWFQPRRVFHLEKKSTSSTPGGVVKERMHERKTAVALRETAVGVLIHATRNTRQGCTTGASPPLSRPRGAFLRPDPAVFNNQSPRLTANADAGI